MAGLFSSLSNQNNTNGSLQKLNRGPVFFAIIFTFAILLTWLFFQTNTISPGLHQHYVENLRMLKEADAEIDGEVLGTRLQIIKNYDTLTRLDKAVVDRSKLLSDIPNYLNASDAGRLAGPLAQLQKAAAEKSDLIDQFKRNNAVFQNSLSFLSTRLDHDIGSVSGSSHSAIINSYIRDVLLFLNNQTQARATAMIDSLAALEAQLTLAPSQELKNIIQHGQIAAVHKAQVRGLTEDILKLPTAVLLDRISSIYADGYHNAQQQANRFGILLFGTALLLTAYLASTMIHLEMARRSVESANREISERYELQKRAEKQLKLHATAFNSSHEGMILTDAKGIILDVNPAFSRITGFERDEVLGRNPRVLKSDRHDEEFYKTMWSSISETGVWRGEIWNRNKFGEVYPELLSISRVSDDEGNVSNFVAVFSDISRLKEQEKKLHHMAFYDPLTDLPNRALLSDRVRQGMAQSYRSGTKMAVCYLDLDDFKPINDSHGHKVGDLVLVEMSRRLSELLRGGDTVSRLGGDEFVLIITGLKDLAEYNSFLSRVLDTISKPITIDGMTESVSGSIGVSFFPDDGHDVDALIRNADQAMYQAKQKGKNGFHVFDPQQDQQIRVKFDQISRMERALENQEFVLHFQPKVELRTGAINGVEALIRWEDPDRGLVPPLEFLPLIEDDPLIIEIGKWVIETAFAQSRTWREQGYDIPVSVNVAGSQLQDPDFVQFLQSMLKKYPDVPAEDIQLEILESSALGDMNHVTRVMEECSALGFAFAIDDFGTGYSSLTYLKRLKADVLKVDQSFVRDMVLDPENMAIVQGTLGLSVAFKSQAVAEGVETIEHGKMLMKLGCQAAQGYCIARPMAGDVVPEWINGWKVFPEWENIKDLSWDKDDYLLISMIPEHRRWANIIVEAVNQGIAIPHLCIDDPRLCQLGQWYYGEGQSRYADLAPYQAMEAQHLEVHRIAGAIDDHYRNGRSEEAKALLPDLLKQSESLVIIIEELQRAVAKPLHH